MWQKKKRKKREKKGICTVRAYLAGFAFYLAVNKLKANKTPNIFSSIRIFCLYKIICLFIVISLFTAE